MAHLILHLFFSGAIAFMPNSTSRPDEMTAYLVKVSPDSCAHYPLLSFELAEGKTCTGKKMTQAPSGGEACDPFSSGKTCCTEYTIGIPEARLPLCICRLANTDIVLDPPSQRRVQRIRPKPGARLPQEEGDEADLAWLLRVANMNPPASRIKSWDQIRDMPKPSRPVIARMLFGWEAAQSCHVDQNYILSEKAYGINKFDFVTFEESHTVKSEHQQALAESVEFSVFLPIQPIHIVLRDLDTPQEAITLSLDCVGGKCPDLSISNSASVLECPRHDIYGFHFAEYYQLSRNEQAERIIPHRKIDVVTVPNEFSCGEKPAGKVVAPVNPFTRIHGAIGSELLALFSGCNPSPTEAELKRLRKLINVFGVDPAEVDRILRDTKRQCKNLHPFFKAAAAEEKLALPPLAILIKLLTTAVSSRVICPSAEFEP
ncbi:MAG TPA: hypothetical protein VHC97_02155 [Thermoanaerobaculia bacterium]|jgi:hypothetical protein|nr:hypothetical protein [Thermoanaerobaculia bacterium]